MSARKLVITIKDSVDEEHINYLYQNSLNYVGQDKVFKSSSLGGKQYIEINGSKLETVDDRVTFNVGVKVAIEYIEKVNRELDSKDHIIYEEEEQSYKGWEIVRTNIPNKEGV